MLRGDDMPVGSATGGRGAAPRRIAPMSGRSGGVARAVVLWALILSPIAAVAWLLASSGKTEFGTWLLLVPLTFCWLAVFDFRRGFGARLVRPNRAVVKSKEANGEE